MKLSKLFHVLGSVSGILGVVMLTAYWNVGEVGMFWGMDSEHLYKDSVIFVLVAIWLQIATLHHMKLEKYSKLI